MNHRLANHGPVHIMDLNKIINNISKNMKCSRCKQPKCKSELHPKTFMCRICEQMVEKDSVHSIAELSNIIRELAIQMKKMQNRIDKLEKERKNNVRSHDKSEKISIPERDEHVEKTIPDFVKKIHKKKYA